MEELGADDSTDPIAEVTVLPVKENFGEELTINPGDNRASFDIAGTSSFRPVCFLDSDHSFCKDSKRQNVSQQAKGTKVIVDTFGLRDPPTVSDTGVDDFPVVDDDPFLVDRLKGLLTLKIQRATLARLTFPYTPELPT